MLKYVVVRTALDSEAPILFPSTLRHCDMVPSGAEPVSAGFALLYEDSLVIPAIGSDTLGLDPRHQDFDLLRSTFGLGSSAAAVPSGTGGPVGSGRPAHPAQSN